MTAEHEFDFDTIRDSLDHCVKCTICESACPVTAVTPLFPGPKYVGPQAERFRGSGPSVDASLDYCSSCGICTLACPQGVHIAEINSQARDPPLFQSGLDHEVDLLEDEAEYVAWLEMERDNYYADLACEYSGQQDQSFDEDDIQMEVDLMVKENQQKLLDFEESEAEKYLMVLNQEPTNPLEDELAFLRKQHSKDQDKIMELEKKREEDTNRVFEECFRNMRQTVNEYDQKIEKLQQKIQCQICMERSRNAIILPCCHFLYCEPCLNQLVGPPRCPTCRSPIQGRLTCNLEV